MIEITDVIDDSLGNLYAQNMEGHEYYGDGSLEALVRFYQECYPSEDIDECSIFRVFRFRVVRTFMDPDTLFRLYRGGMDSEAIE